MLGRTLDRSYDETIRRDISTVTGARLCVNALYRYVGPFLAVVARGLDVSVAELGVALTDRPGHRSRGPGRRPPRRPPAATDDDRPRGRRRRHRRPRHGDEHRSRVVHGRTADHRQLRSLVLVVGAGSWIADHVPFDQRSRVVGLNEMSWALGLLVGVSAMGLVTALSSWRWAYAVAAVAASVAMAAVLRRLEPVAPRARPRRRGHPVGDRHHARQRLTADGWLAVARRARPVAASEALFVTFGPWLQDEFGVGDAVLAAATFGLGASN